MGVDRDCALYSEFVVAQGYFEVKFIEAKRRMSYCNRQASHVLGFQVAWGEAMPVYALCRTSAIVTIQSCRNHTAKRRTVNQAKGVYTRVLARAGMPSTARRTDKLPCFCLQGPIEIETQSSCVCI